MSCDKSHSSPVFFFFLIYIKINVEMIRVFLKKIEIKSRLPTELDFISLINLNNLNKKNAMVINLIRVYLD